VDAIQGLGVLPMHMGALSIDALVADGHKWLLGPEGAGLLATTPALRERLYPVITGWRNIVREPKSYFLEALELRTDGRRFEPGATNDIGIAGLAAALDLLTTIDRENIHTRIEMLSRLLTRILLAHGWDVFSPGSGHPIAGIVSARHPGVSPDEAARRLAERRVVVSVRQGYVRFSPHFYTTRGELEALDRILEKVGL
jgi:selenocysteine lyase/cysteine desulfurase